MEIFSLLRLLTTPICMGVREPRFTTTVSSVTAFFLDFLAGESRSLSAHISGSSLCDGRGLSQGTKYASNERPNEL